MKKIDFLIIGCGFAGATFANLAAEHGYTVKLVDKRNHIGGNCYTYKDELSQVEVHKYGPHIFHTNSPKVWAYVNRFSKFNNYVNRVKVKTGNQIYGMPINLHTINQFFGKDFSPEEAKKHIDTIRLNDLKPTNFEEFVLHHLGKDLYEAFYKYYTIKHWGVNPTEIPISTAKRLPIRFDYNDNYFDDQFQGIPKDGYTELIRKMIDHKNIQLALGEDFEIYRNAWRLNFEYLVFTGSIDNYFNYKNGFLPYRTLRFEAIRGKNIIGNAVMNYTDNSEPFTRIHEHKWFTPERKLKKSIAFKEYSSNTDSRKNPIYPIRNPTSEAMYNTYLKLAETEDKVIFVGRLAEFKYYDMHQVIAASMNKFEKLMKAHEK